MYVPASKFSSKCFATCCVFYFADRLTNIIPSCFQLPILSHGVSVLSCAINILCY
jgi:hypothetical protein